MQNVCRNSDSNVVSINKYWCMGNNGYSTWFVFVCVWGGRERVCVCVCVCVSVCVMSVHAVKSYFREN